MSDVSFSVVIVSYNSRGDLPNLLRDLGSYAPSNPVIVIDNASPDGTADVVSTEFPQVQLVRNTLNVGYARAVNQGFRQCTTRDVFLLNPDMRIQGPEVFALLAESLGSSKCSAVAGPLQFKDVGDRLRLNFTWSYWTPRALWLFLQYAFRRKVSHVEPLHVSFLNAGCLYVRREAYVAVGGLNEKYFLYGEEPDLFLKFKRFGFECWLVPDARVLHAREQSLRSVSLSHRLRFKAAGVRNILDAVIRGVFVLIVDRITGRRPANACR
ncbi:MAG TPA: glycosyltransferase family 2 protein [Anaerolineales bacterium]|nr:glycosyltransferase family 2 protein [Anaerolineales bacterium]